MNLDEVRTLLEQFRTQERGESASQEIKRQWWNFKDDGGLQEFLRDIAAMANADTDDEKIILIGIKGDQLYDAPLPEDEAQLQTRLQHIEPRPRVRFTDFSVEPGQRVSLIQILPPYDKPYVITSPKAKQQMPVRRGTAIGPATRREIDHWYETLNTGAQIQLLWQGKPISSGDQLSYESEFLEIETPERRETFSPLSPHLRATLRDFEKIATWGSFMHGNPEAYVNNQNAWIHVDGFSVSNCGRRQLQHVILDIQFEANPRLTGTANRIHDVTDAINPGYTIETTTRAIELAPPITGVPLSLPLRYSIGAHTGVLLEGQACLQIVFKPKTITMKQAQEMASAAAAAAMFNPSRR